MDELTQLLRDADPLARESELSDFEAAIMRQRVVLTAEEPDTPRIASWKAAIAIAAVVALAAAGALFDSRAHSSIDRAAPNLASEGEGSMRTTASPTQMLFQTPGGTRIVWTINPDLNF